MNFPYFSLRQIMKLSIANLQFLRLEHPKGLVEEKTKFLIFWYFALNLFLGLKKN